MAVDFFKTFVTDLDDPDTDLASAGTASSEFSRFIDTGSYILNASLSGSIFGGLPDNKVTALAGDPGVGKTFYALGIVKNFLDLDPKARVFYFDSESAVTNQMMTDRGIDIKRVAKSEPETLERFRHTAVKLAEQYKALDESKRFPLLVVLDSLSALPSNKEVTDAIEDSDKKDMTKPGVIKGTFRILRLKLGKLGIPMVVTNHVYESVGAYVPTKNMSGGKGLMYAADSILFLSKKQEKDDDNKVVGNVIHVHAKKSRLSRENTKVDTRVFYSGGLDRYYGLLEQATAAELVKKSGNKWEFPDGQKGFEKEINAHPEKFFTPEFLKTLDEYIKTKFTYTPGPTEVDDEADAKE